MDELEESAKLPARGFVLMQEGKLAVVEGVEELLPADDLQLVVGFGEIDTQDTLATGSSVPFTLQACPGAFRSTGRISSWSVVVIASVIVQVRSVSGKPDERQAPLVYNRVPQV